MLINEKSYIAESIYYDKYTGCKSWAVCKENGCIVATFPSPLFAENYIRSQLILQGIL